MLTTWEFALEYADAGFAVFPLHTITDGKCTCGEECKSPGKHPKVMSWVNSRTTNKASINKWGQAGLWDSANIGIATGSISDLIVVDIDPKNGGDESFSDMVTGYEMPATAHVLTGSGGSHFYFRHDDTIPGGAVREGSAVLGIDVQSDGRYVVAPPSTHYTGTRYRWLDIDETDEIRDSMCEMPIYLADRLRIKKAVSLTTKEEDLPPTLLEDSLIEALKFVNADDRDSWVSVGQALQSTGDPKAYDLWVDWSMGSDKFDADDQWRVWNSFKQLGGRTVSTIYYLAAQGGYHGAPALIDSPDDPDFERAIAIALEDMAQVLPEVDGKRERRRYFSNTIFDITHTDYPNPKWVVDDLMPAESLMVMSGEPKTGKTWMALEIALGIASGTSAFGEFDCQQGEVAMFLTETMAAELKERIVNLIPRGGLGKITVEPMTHIDLCDDMQVAELIASVRLSTPDCKLVVLDPLKHLHSADENDATSMGEVMKKLMAIRTVLGCTVLVTHHSKKPQKGSTGRPGTSMRGSGVIHGAVDGGIYLTSEGQPLKSKVNVELRRAPGLGFACHLRPGSPTPWSIKRYQIG